MEDKSSPSPQFLMETKTLANFLRLSPEEEKLKEDVLSLIKNIDNNHNEDAIVSKIADPNNDMISLIKIAAHSEIFFKFLHHENLKSLWQEAWRLMGTNNTFTSNNTKVPYNMRPQLNIDCIDLLFGYFYYQESIKLREIVGKTFSANELDFLHKAESYFSFHALKALNKHDLQVLKLPANNGTMYTNLEEIMKRVLKAAKYHGTPGYLMAVETCYSIAQYHKVLKNKSKITPSLIVSIQYLKLADLTFNASEASIHNAYFGLGIAASNEFGLSSINEIKNFIIKHSGEYLNPRPNY